MASTDGMTAAARVFAVPELLENILTRIVKRNSKGDNPEYWHDEVVSLFRLQMVNRKFRNVIARSTELQQSMFLKPAVTETEELQLIPFNPLLVYFEDLAGLEGGSLYSWWYGRRDGEYPDEDELEWSTLR